MSVSVAMTTYQGAAYVLEQLSSIVAQTPLPAEIVVCDDGSTDGTAELVAAFAAASTVPVRLHVNAERLGWRENFMRAASLCESDLIAFCDQDDVWEPRKLELLDAAFADADTLVVFHDATIVDADLHPIGPFLQGEGEPDHAPTMTRGPWRDVYGFTMAFRSRLLDLWGHWPSSVDKSVGHQRAAHDQWLLFLGSALGTTQHLPDRLALYRQHDRNAVSAKDALRAIARTRVPVDHRYLVNLRLKVVTSRIRILEGIARDHAEFGAAAAAAHRIYAGYGDRLAAQAVIHNATSPVERLRNLGWLLRRRAYVDDVWALGRAAIASDCVAVALGPTVLAWVRAARSRRSGVSSSRRSRRRGWARPR